MATGHRPDLTLRKRYDGKASLVIFLGAIAVALWRPLLACAGYVAGAILWLIADRRIERNLSTR